MHARRAKKYPIDVRICVFRLVIVSVLFRFQSVSCMHVTSLIPVLELHALVNYHLPQFTLESTP